MGLYNMSMQCVGNGARRHESLQMWIYNVQSFPKSFELSQEKDLNHFIHFFCLEKITFSEHNTQNYEPKQEI